MKRLGIRKLESVLREVPPSIEVRAKEQAANERREQRGEGGGGRRAAEELRHHMTSATAQAAS